MLDPAALGATWITRRGPHVVVFCVTVGITESPSTLFPFRTATVTDWHLQPGTPRSLGGHSDKCRSECPARTNRMCPCNREKSKSSFILLETGGLYHVSSTNRCRIGGSCCRVHRSNLYHTRRACCRHTGDRRRRVIRIHSGNLQGVRAFPGPCTGWAQHPQWTGHQLQDRRFDPQWGKRPLQ